MPAAGGAPLAHLRASITPSQGRRRSPVADPARGCRRRRADAARYRRPSSRSASSPTRSIRACRGMTSSSQAATGSPAYVHPERPPGERRLEDPLSEIPGEEQAVRPVPAQGHQKSQLRDADVLSLVDRAEVERRTRSLCDAHRQPREHAGLRQPPLFGERRPDPREDRPEQLPLLLGQPALAAEPLHVAVVLPTRELPGVDHGVPFRPERSAHRNGGLRHPLPPARVAPGCLSHSPDRGGRRSLRRDASRCRHRMHLQTLGDLRLVPDEAPEARS